MSDELRAPTPSASRPRSGCVAAGEGRLTLEELAERVDAAYDATTRGELQRLLADLPSGELVLPEPAGAVEAPRSRRRVLALMCGQTLSGRVRLEPRTDVVSVMGGVELDLNDAVFGASEATITVACVMGGVELRVPEGVHVVDEVVAVTGGVDVRGPAEAPPPGAPVVRVKGFVLMGGLEIKRGRSKRDRKRLGLDPPPPPHRLH